MKKGILGLFLCVLLCFFGLFQVSANSAPKEHYGTSSADILIKDEECPIEVLKEDLTIHIKDFPVLYDEESFLNYDNYVDAVYTLYNPMSYDENLTLVFPFDPIPSYYNLGLPMDYSKYSILLNSAPVDKKIRYTYLDEEFQTEGQLDRLLDVYKEDSFYSTDLTVYKYSYQADFENLDTLLCQCALNLQSTSTKIIGSGFYSNGIYQCFPDKSGNIEIYVLGEDIELNWEFFKSNYYWEGTPTEADIRLVSKQQTTFMDYILSLLPENYDIPEMDWFNIIVEYLNSVDMVKFYPFDYQTLERYLMRWYEYSIIIPAGETVIHEVMAPIYPLIVKDSFTPAKYLYRYFLSPASMWSNFSDLTITLDTPFYMLDSSLNGFEESEGGFVLKSQTLPEGDLNFTLCESLHPKKNISAFAVLAYIFIGLIVFFFIVVFLAILIVFLMVSIKSKYKSVDIQVNRIEVFTAYLSIICFLISLFFNENWIGYIGYGFFVLTVGLTVFDSIKYRKYYKLRLAMCIIAVLLGIILLIGCMESGDDLNDYHSIIFVLDIIFGALYILFGILNTESKKRDIIAKQSTGINEEGK